MKSGVNSANQSLSPEAWRVTSLPDTGSSAQSLLFDIGELVLKVVSHSNWSKKALYCWGSCWLPSGKFWWRSGQTFYCTGVEAGHWQQLFWGGGWVLLLVMRQLMSQLPLLQDVYRIPLLSSAAREKAQMASTHQPWKLWGSSSTQHCCQDLTASLGSAKKNNIEKIQCIEKPPGTGSRTTEFMWCHQREAKSS